MIDIHKLKEHVYDVVGALYEVHKELGAGLNEYCYQEGLQIQLEESDIPYKKELTFYPKYHGQQMKTHYRVDFLCKEDIILECKSVEQLNNDHRAQLFNYMRITKKCRGILLNFGEKKLRAERYLYLPEDDNFILLTQDNYMQYITD